MESVTETIKDKTKAVKEKTVDKIDDDDYKERTEKDLIKIHKLQQIQTINIEKIEETN